MKKFIHIITALVLFSSCSDDFLNLAPLATPNENTFFKTEGHFNQAVGGIYNELRETLTWPGFLIGESRSDNAFLPRSSEEDVYKSIINDATDAIAKLEVVKFPQSGLVTQGAARMLLAQVLMTMPERDYASAEAQLREIMKMGYKLLPDYNDVFDTARKNNEESIFEVQYQQGNQGQQCIPIVKIG